MRVFQRTSIAVLLTCHNRKEKTLACLRRVYEQELPPGVALSVFLVDDGSTDGTADAIRERFPSVRLIPGNGSLFWNGGMRTAFAKAMREGFDYYLWVNDDTVLNRNAIDVLMRTASSVPDPKHAIVVGSVCDPDTGVHTYGGVKRYSRLRPLRFSPVIPALAPQPCDTVNGNCVLVPAGVVKRIGNLSAEFRHGMGDFDYGLRALKAGCSVWVAPGYLGTCKQNARTGTWKDTSLSLRERWRKLVGFKGLPPREWLVFCLRHAGFMWPVNWMLPYARVVVSSIFPRFA
jgi:GT2 family glycosyltransferase